MKFTGSLDTAHLVKSFQEMKSFAAKHEASLDLVVLSTDLEDLIYKAFFDGKLNGHHTMNTDHRRKLRTHLCGVRIRFDSRVDVYHPVMMFGHLKNESTEPNNPVCPGTGPGADPGGGSPVANHSVQLSMAA